MSDSKQTKNTYKETDKLDYIILLSVLSCIFLTGGFNWYACIIPCILLLIYVLLKWDFSLTWQSIALLAMVVMGFISIAFSKGDKQNALYELEKILCFILSVYAGSKCKDKDTIKFFIILAAIFVSVVGLLAYCNIIKSTGFVFFDRKIRRVQSFIQYANTTSVLLACGYFLTLDNLNNTKVNICISHCILLTLYLTVSKASIALYLLIGTIIVFTNNEISERFIIQNILCLIFFFILAITGSHYLHSLSFILIVASIIIECNVLNFKINKKTLVILWISCLIICCIAGIVFMKITNINLFVTFEKRVNYMRDACKLIRNNLLLGIGPGAWRYYQFSVQTTQYDVMYIHNGWLQFLVENGSVFVLLLFMIIVSSVKNLIKNKNYHFVACTTLIILHSLVDFDLSFGIILILFGLMLGIGITTCEKRNIFMITNISVIIFAISIILYMCSEYFVRARFEKNYLNGEYDKALSNAYVLELICPYDSNLQLSIAVLDENNAREYVEKAYKLSPLDPSILKQSIDYYIYIGEENILDLIKTYIDLMPKQELTYTNAYEFLRQILEKGGCSQEEYDNMTKYIDSVMKSQSFPEKVRK